MKNGVHICQHRYEESVCGQHMKMQSECRFAHMLKSDDVIRKVLDRVGIEFNIDSHRALATYIYALYEEGKEPTPQRPDEPYRR